MLGRFRYDPQYLDSFGLVRLHFGYATPGGKNDDEEQCPGCHMKISADSESPGRNV